MLLKHVYKNDALNFYKYLLIQQQGLFDVVFSNSLNIFFIASDVAFQ